MRDLFKRDTCLLSREQQKLTRLAAEVDMLRMFIRLAVDIQVLPFKKVVPTTTRNGSITRELINLGR